MKKPKVSIIIPVYNVEKYIDKCLHCLVNQTLKNIEIIIVNDGSPDNSQIIIDKYVEKYPNKIKSFIKENGGQGSARNFGLTKATGEYIGYVDSDDYIELDMYEKLYNKAKTKNYDIVSCGNYNVSENDGNKKTDNVLSIYNNKLENTMFGKIAVWNKIYKKEILLENNIEFKEKVWYEDLAFTIKAILNSKSFALVNEPLYNYLIRQGSTMNNSNIKRNLEILEAFDDILEYIKHKDNKKIFEKIEFLAVDHIYISAIVRIIRAEANQKNKKEIINKLIEYMNLHFPKYKNNKYIKTLPKNRKIIYNLINAKQYTLINLIFKIKRG